MRHVEKDGSHVFCGAHVAHCSEYVLREQWQESPTALMAATCSGCLRGVLALGGWARNALDALALRQSRVVVVGKDEVAK